MLQRFVYRPIIGFAMEIKLVTETVRSQLKENENHDKRNRELGFRYFKKNHKYLNLEI